MVGEEGFEPTRPVRPADFKSASSAGSDTRPRRCSRLRARPCVDARPAARWPAPPATRDPTARRGDRSSLGCRTGRLGIETQPQPAIEWRRRADSNRRMGVLQTPALPLGYVATSRFVNGRWSGRWDLNPRPSPWQGDALPLSYSRAPAYAINADAIITKAKRVSTRGSLHRGNDLRILRRRSPAGDISRPTASA